MPVLTAEDAANYLGIDQTTAGFALVVRAVNQRIADFCRRTFEAARYTEYHDMRGDNNGTLEVWEPPINTLVSLTDDANTTIITGRSNRSISITADVELYPDRGPYSYLKLVNTESAFTPGDKTVKVVYDGGYEGADMPGDLVLAACEFVAAKWEGPERIARSQQNIDGAAISWADGDAEAPDIPKSVAQVLRRYRRVVV